MTTYYQLDNDLKDNEYQQSNAQSSFVTLPFDAPVLYWKHGDVDVTPGTIGHYGRWNCQMEDFDKIAQAANIPAPKEIETRVKKDRNGRPTSETYKVYAWRAVVFAVIASRSRWIHNQRTGKNNSHTQILVHLFDKNSEGAIIPTVPAILSAKVLASGALENCVKKWFDTIHSFNTVKIPPIYFYMAVGTFGEQSKFTGSHGTSTLPELYTPQNLTADNLPFVGNGIARKMSDLKLQAQDWLNDQDWLTGNYQQSGQQQQAQRPEYHQEPTPQESDSIPF